MKRPRSAPSVASTTGRSSGRSVRPGPGWPGADRPWPDPRACPTTRRGYPAAPPGWRRSARRRGSRRVPRCSRPARCWSNPIWASGSWARIQASTRRTSHTACAVACTSSMTSSPGNTAPLGSPLARGPCIGSTGSTTLSPKSSCRCQARNSEVQARSAHLGAVHAHQPGAGLVVPEHQRVLAVVAGVAHPAIAAGLLGEGLVPTGEGQPLVGTAAAGVGLHGDVGRGRRAVKNPCGFSSQPARGTTRPLGRLRR